ncbi:MAG TPA: 6-carboxytetrahydropterin synthase [Candidatus Binatia bacterium]|nr:6-carboxytetrahydropterin synthase [Candidatus Binatia bacterium]
MGGPQRFDVFVGKEYLKFNAAHFIAYRGFRERLHGHNYQVTVRVEGELGADGYVVDFGVVKRATKRVCEALDEYTILPAASDCLSIVETGDSVEVTYEDGTRFVLPRSDVVLLPIVHSSAEELARYVAGRVREELLADGARPWTRLEVSVSETHGQAATFAATWSEHDASAARAAKAGRAR